MTANAAAPLNRLFLNVVIYFDSTRYGDVWTLAISAWISKEIFGLI